MSRNPATPDAGATAPGPRTPRRSTPLHGCHPRKACGYRLYGQTLQRYIWAWVGCSARPNAGGLFSPPNVISRHGSRHPSCRGPVATTTAPQGPVDSVPRGRFSASKHERRRTCAVMFSEVRWARSGAFHSSSTPCRRHRATSAISSSALGSSARGTGHETVGCQRHTVDVTPSGRPGSQKASAGLPCGRAHIPGRQPTATAAPACATIFASPQVIRTGKGGA